MLKNIALAFIPVFVAVDAIGVMPIFLSLTEGVERKQRLKIIAQSMMTALGLAVGFIFLGKAIFKFLGIEVADFMIAGGAILFCIAIIDMVNPVKERRRFTADDLGVVPIGTPLIVGPAVLTTSLLSVPHYGLFPTLIAVILNITLAGLILSASAVFIKYLGEAWSKALSKVMSLLLAAIAVMLIRKGITQLF